MFVWKYPTLIGSSIVTFALLQATSSPLSLSDYHKGYCSANEDRSVALCSQCPLKKMVGEWDCGHCCHCLDVQRTKTAVLGFMVHKLYSVEFPLTLFSLWEKTYVYWLRKGKLLLSVCFGFVTLKLKIFIICIISNFAEMPTLFTRKYS